MSEEEIVCPDCGAELVPLYQVGSNIILEYLCARCDGRFDPSRIVGTVIDVPYRIEDDA